MSCNCEKRFEIKNKVPILIYYSFILTLCYDIELVSQKWLVYLMT